MNFPAFDPTSFVGLCTNVWNTPNGPYFVKLLMGGAIQLNAVYVGVVEIQCGVLISCLILTEEVFGNTDYLFLKCVQVRISVK